jgi:hypothetical protein
MTEETLRYTVTIRSLGNPAYLTPTLEALQRALVPPSHPRPAIQCVI